MEKPASPVSSSAPVNRRALRWSASALVVLFGCSGPGAAEAHALPALPQTVWFSWGFAPEIVLPLLLVWWLYGRGLIRLWSRAGGRGVRPHRVACFAAGCASLVAALVSPLDAMAGALASAHMAQHLILLAVAPPLLLLGQPEIMLLWAMPASCRGPIGRWFRGRRLRSLFGWLAGPMIAGILHGIAIWGWHMPALYEIALRNPGVHIAEHATFLGTGLLYWHGLVQATRPGRGGQGPAVFSAFVTMLHTNILGALLTFSARPWYSYGRWPEYWGLTPLEDQQLSGLIMWIPMGTVYMLAALWIVSTCLSGLPRARRAPFSLVDERPAVADGEEG